MTGPSGNENSMSKNKGDKPQHTPILPPPKLPLLSGAPGTEYNPHIYTGTHSVGHSPSCLDQVQIQIPVLVLPSWVTLESHLTSLSLH